jgi:hypothetical protein
MFLLLQEFFPGFFRPGRLLMLVLADPPFRLLRGHKLADSAIVHGHHAFCPKRQVHKFGEDGVRCLLAGQKRTGRPLDRAGRGVE